MPNKRTASIQYSGHVIYLILVEAGSGKGCLITGLFMGMKSESLLPP